MSERTPEDAKRWGEAVDIVNAWTDGPAREDELVELIAAVWKRRDAELALLRRVAEAAEKALYRGKPETTALDDLEFDENGDPTDLFNALAAWKASRTP